MARAADNPGESEPLDIAGEPAGAVAELELPRSFRFGLRELILLITLCGVQFALMYYFGPLIGLLIGLGVCCIGLVALIVASIPLRHRHATPLMERMDLLAIRLTVTILLLICGSVIAGVGSLIYYTLADLQAKHDLEKRWGCDYNIRLVNKTNEEVVNVIHVTAVTPGGAFAQAGFQPDDVIVSDLAPRDFINMLEENRGRQVAVTVASAGTTKPLEQCATRELTLDVPD